MEHLLQCIDNPKRITGHFWIDSVVKKRFYWVLQLQTLRESKGFVDLFVYSPVWKDIFTHFETKVELKELIKFVNYMHNHCEDINPKTHKEPTNFYQAIDQANTELRNHEKVFQFLLNTKIFESIHF